MKKRVLILLSSIALLIMIFIIPFILKNSSETINQVLSVSATLVASLATVYTLIIAVLLYNKFGIENTYIEEKTNKVFALLEEIMKINFIIGNNGDSHYIKMINPSKYKPEKIPHINLLFSRDYSMAMKNVFELCNSPLIPQEVSWRIKLLRFEFIFFVDNEEDYYKVTVDNAKVREAEKFGLFNGSEMNFSQFLHSLELIKYDIVNWLNNNSSIPINLNI